MTFPTRQFSAVLVFCTTLVLTVAAQAQEAAPPKVSVAAAYTDQITEEATFIGRGEAIDKVSIVARVSGFLLEQAVANGAEVAEGDLLFRIEPDAYNATLEARHADLARAEANLELRTVELARKEELLRRQAVPESERDVAKAQELAAEAEVRAAKAAITQAELDVSYTEIHAPFSGRIGRIASSVGDLVGPNTPPLVDLVREAPMFVTFSLNEKQLITVIENLGEGIRNTKPENSPEVFVELPNGHLMEEPGRIVFIDNRIDPQTGAISVRAAFDNTERLIVDGAFLSVRIQSLEPVTKTLIPQAAIQRDQRGEFVLVVGQNQTVEQRYVQTGDQKGTAVIVEDGIREGEAVIVEGLQRVRPGVAVDAVVTGTSGD